MFENNSWIDADYRAALGHLEAGRLADAELLLRAILAMEPNYPPAWLSLGVTLMRGENFAGAVDCFSNLTSTDPGHVDGWIHLSHALRALGRSDDGLAALARAAELRPNATPIYEMQAQAHIGAGRLPEALAAATKAVELEPDSARLVSKQGHLHRALRQLDEAAACFRRSLELTPDQADPWADLGTVLQVQGKIAAAKEAYERALQLVPGHRLAAINLAQLLINLGALADSRRLLDGLLAAQETAPDLFRLAGEQARLEGRGAEAIEFYQRALTARPDHAETLHGLGQALQSLGRLQEAVDAFSRATNIAPRHANSRASLGAIFLMTGQLDQGIAFYRDAVALDPNQPAWLENLAWALFDLGRVQDALAALERVASLGPDALATESRILYCLPFLPDIDPMGLADRMRGWGEKMVALAAQMTHAAAPDDGERILRVGYLLPNMGKHPLLPFIEPLLAAHDRSRVALFVYTTTPDTTALPPSLAEAGERWRLIGGANRNDVAEQMRRDGIDVLVDVTGHRPAHRLDVLAHRSAPVQLSWLVGTGLGTGLDCVDGVIGDQRLTPPAVAAQFTETVLRPFPAYACYRGDPSAPGPGAVPAGSAGTVTFGYAGRIARLNDGLVAAWAEILSSCPGSRLLLDHGSLRQPGPQDHLRARFAAHGIAAERIEAGFSASVWSAWQRIDIALDPFPSSAGTTILEGLWMGVPSVTLAGPLPSGRFGAAILPHVGLEDWVVESVAAYVARAIAAAGDLGALTELRRTLRDRLAASPLADARGFASALEETYRRLWRGHCRAS